MYNASDRKKVRAAEKAARQAERERRDIVTGLMSTASGRRWVLEILERCHVFATSFDPNAALTAFREGERNIGLSVLNDVMSACPDQYVQMMRERNERDLAANNINNPDDAFDRTASTGGHYDGDDYDGADDGAEAN